MLQPWRSPWEHLPGLGNPQYLILGILVVLMAATLAFLAVTTVRELRKRRAHPRP